MAESTVKRKDPDHRPYAAMRLGFGADYFTLDEVLELCEQAKRIGVPGGARFLYEFNTRELTDRIVIQEPKP